MIKKLFKMGKLTNLCI